MKLGHSERERKGVYGLGGLVENCVVYGDRGYRGCEGVIVCDSKDMRAKRQVVEALGRIRNFLPDQAPSIHSVHTKGYHQVNT